MICNLLQSRHDKCHFPFRHRTRIKAKNALVEVIPPCINRDIATTQLRFDDASVNSQFLRIYSNTNTPDCTPGFILLNISR